MLHKLLSVQISTFLDAVIARTEYHTNTLKNLDCLF
jgi:hypothetical protein